MNFYFDAAKVLDHLDAKKGSIKGLIASIEEKDRKRSTALIIETLKYRSFLSDVINASKMMKDERKLTSFNLALLLVHDLLLGKGIQAGDGPIKQAILRHKTRLNGEFQKLKIKRGALSNSQLAQSGDERAASIPRYVRVNTSLWSTEDAIQYYLSRGFTLSNPMDSSKGFTQDAHIPDLLAFAPSTSFADDHAYLGGKVILQDKASCFPAVVLAPPPTENSIVIDATAAPGNKTSHLSALMKNKGKLYAFERDRKRYGTLQKMLATAKCQNVIPTNADFLTVNPEDDKYRSTTHILLDPSCSGSGIVNRLDHLIETDEEEDVTNDRLAKLAAFQLKMIQHAMKFPKVQKIVYSTCSIHATENEHVVRSALDSKEANAGPFSLAPRDQVIPTWSRRGLPEEMNCEADADSVIRCSPDGDCTNGFFVSCFIRGNKLHESNLKRKLIGEDQQPEKEKKVKSKKRKPNQTNTTS
ncbi:S-adenosyl-L-methionine-dependent methyltransferase [Coprinopsis marcescibilis]|uniref:S-adenosyl-L-methionine-dependent methyltransferase n=1 Tax=Coprinopsis marcescibilis TaxID=230819 RepID=A0A5C3L3H8_COPMA|nr:S-adenosyl-L-methionine-dependent methyltransferase [Coprinopsis marcescibilis]